MHSWSDRDRDKYDCALTALRAGKLRHVQLLKNEFLTPLREKGYSALPPFTPRDIVINPRRFDSQVYSSCLVYLSVCLFAL